MTRVNVAEAKARLSELIERALSGEEVVIARRNQAAVRLVPEATPAPKGLLGLFAGEIAMSDDFDAPLPDFEDHG